MDSKQLNDRMTVGITRSGESFLFVYRNTEVGRVRACRIVGTMAGDPDNIFTWTDAAVISNLIRRNA